MKKVTVNQANQDEIAWINSKYEEVNFVNSNFENEFIVIAKVEEERAGIGRLVKIDAGNVELGGIYALPDFRGLGVAANIVRTLCEQNPFKETTIWCLPFENLLKFYAKFGFEKYESGEVPTEVIEKLEWCNSDNRYEKEVVLLYKK